MDDSEWEYEYDDTATEDIYVTLDLTTHIPPALTKGGAAQEGKTKGKRQVRRSGHAAPKKPASDATPMQTQPELPPAETEVEEDGEIPAPFLPNKPSRMQIVDLHGPNPLISYKNKLYTCHWATDVGTSLFVTGPSDETNEIHSPLRSTSSFDLLGTTSARLMAIPATIRPRAEPKTTTLSRSTAPEVIELTGEGQRIERSTTGLKLTLPPNAKENQVSQARFLERLSAIKNAKGERDLVPVHTVKGYRLPDNWEEVRDRWLEQEAAGSARHQSEVASRAAIAADWRALRASTKTPARDATPGGVQGTPASPAGSDVDDLREIDAAHLDEEDDQSETPAQLTKRKRGWNPGGRRSNLQYREKMGLPAFKPMKSEHIRAKRVRIEIEDDDEDEEADEEDYDDADEVGGEERAGEHEDHNDDEDDDEDDDGDEDEYMEDEGTAADGTFTGPPAAHQGINPSTRLRRAILLNDTALVRRIIRAHPQLLRNPDFDDKSNTSLHLAASKDYSEIAILLLEAGHEDGEISRNADWDTPLMVAAKAGSVHVGRILIERFPRCVGWRDRRGRDALSLSSMHPSSTPLLPYLLEASASPSARDNDGDTALHHASASGSLKALRILLSAGADPLAQNADHWTPLAYSQTVAAEVYFKNLVAEFERRRVEGQRSSNPAASIALPGEKAGSEMVERVASVEGGIPRRVEGRERDVLRKKGGGVRVVTEEDMGAEERRDSREVIRSGGWSTVEVTGTLTPRVERRERFGAEGLRARTDSAG